MSEQSSATPSELKRELPAPKKPLNPDRYAVIDKAGNPLGFYATDIHKKMPAGAVKLTEAQYQQWVAGLSATPTQRYQLVCGTLVAYNPPPPELTLAQQAKQAVASGLRISCSAFASVTFPTDTHALNKIGAVLAAINSSDAFPGGASTYPIKDSDGEWHYVTVAQFKAIAAALSSYVSACNLIEDGNPLRVAALPAASVNLSL